MTFSSFLLVNSLIVGRLRPTPRSRQLFLRVPQSPPVPLSPPTLGPIMLVPWSRLFTPRSPGLSSASLPPIQASTTQRRSAPSGFFPLTSTSHTSPRGSRINRATSLPPPGPYTDRSSPRPLPTAPPRPAWSSPCIRRLETGVPQAQGATPAPWTWTTPASSSPSRRGDSRASGQDGKDTGTTPRHNLGRSWAMALVSSQVFTGWTLVASSVCVIGSFCFPVSVDTDLVVTRTILITPSDFDPGL